MITSKVDAAGDKLILRVKTSFINCQQVSVAESQQNLIEQQSGS